MLTDNPVNPLSSGIPFGVAHNQHRKRVSSLRSGGLQKRTQNCFFGVETCAELVWEGWEPGLEYTKSLILRNIRGKLQKLTFRPPETKFFSTPFPQTILLSPGTSFSLPVTFQPLEKCEYMDTIEFQGKEGTFHVSLRAVIPHHALEVPDTVMLPPCAAQHSSQTSFLFRNSSKLQTGFRWCVDPPFQLSPETGQLKPGEECRVTVEFKPQQAVVYQAEACCAFGDDGESSCTVLLRGLSKYPHLQINSMGQEEGCKVLEFGSVAVGNSLEKHFEIYNLSTVSTTFNLSWLRRPPLMESVFHCEVHEGKIAPHSVLKVPVCFSPLTVDSISVDYLCLTCHGAVSEDLLKVSGTCIGPIVSLSTSILDFGCVEEGTEVTHNVQIINTSTVLAHYQFDVDTGSHSVFSVDKPCGSLPGSSKLTLRVKFRPHHPIAYHKTMTCLLLHREPLFLDLIGTCHSEQLKPAILKPRHLSVYRLNLLRGLTCYPPDLLSALLEERRLKLDESGALQMQEIPTEDTNNTTPLFKPRSPLDEYFHVNSAPEVETELYNTSNSTRFPIPHVTVQPSELLFYDGPASKSVSITNYTKGKICLMWSHGAESPFSISPLSCELGPLKTTAFRVTYSPNQQNVFHGAQLECFTFYKVLRDHRNVEDQTLCPPWCLIVRVSGHSFQPGKEHFIPSFSLQHSKIVFPALKQVSYRSILLQNTGDLPLIFRLDPEECPSACVLPSSGLVPPGSHQILMFRCTPSPDHPSSIPLTLQLNASPNHTQVLNVVAVAEKLSMSMEEGGSLFFQPTALGSCSERTLWVKNLSRVPVEFKWRLCGSDQGVLSVLPDTDILQPNESKVQKWSFAPKEEMMYNMKPSLTFWPVQTPQCKKSRLTIKAVGLASKGSLQAEHPVIDLGEVLVESCKSFEVPLLNDSPCAVSYFLTTQQSVTDTGLLEDMTQDPLVLEMDNVKGTIPAECRLPIRCTVRPARRAHYCWTISYHILSASGSVEGEPQSICHVQAEGVYPILEVMDVRSCGSVEGLSKLQLWRLFNLDALNTYLRRDPSPSELTFRVPTRHSFRHCPSIFTSAMMDFSFSAAPQGSDPTSILLLFKNPGSIPVEWSFLFPEDQQIELEYWAETGDFSPSELHLMKIQEHRLFSISPRSGKLQPGQQRTVQFTYRHEFVGTDRLPVLLKLSHGREILLNFTGITVERDRRYIHLSSNRNIFAPMAIGGFSPPKQVYELYNAGTLPVRYHIDTTPLEELMEENFSHPILQCLNPGGEIEPGHTALVEWIFSPLEAKTYSVDIPIHVMEGDSMFVTFEGQGFDERESEPIQVQDGRITVPCTQRIPLPGQVVFLSEERVCFGDIPVCSRSTRILFLTNVSHTDEVLYKWNVTSTECRKTVTIRPEGGRLAPGESVLCILTIQTSGSPAFYKQDLLCEITLVRMLAQYHKDLRQWEEETERQKYEFTLTEKDLLQTKQLDKCTQEGAMFGQKTGTKKYKTLPPIRSSDHAVGSPSPRPSRAEQRAQQQTGQERRRRPEPPRPTLLHLGVTARSHSLMEYQTHFPTQFNTHYINRSRQTKHSQSGTGESCHHPADLPPLTLGLERDVITHVLISLLQSLLDEPQFQQSLVEDDTEQLPYFTQLRPAPALLPQTLPRSAEDSQDPCKMSGVSSATPAKTFTGNCSTADTPKSECDCESLKELQEEIKMKVQESIRRLPEFCDLLEDILLNTLQNLMMEAFLGELVLTTRPRIIALPPSSSRKNSLGSNRQSSAESNKEQLRPLVTSPTPYRSTQAIVSTLEPEQ
ncbi:LOW QUALITY PROTEIN: cilia- and flagella-associated protein 65 [Megalobrama amblycephala]|uniref:LOW QUALITY PROTEIN: cilia- and flagella-associated protein 65 n=1 Tax=Megalobrama amblycephala TaxID=75352 RepID=UPI002013F8AF|nr:LOW QUALITY PROTEIN: cilia- and flagella-associated protein 65 [Megalobrama amblycephala]